MQIKVAEHAGFCFGVKQAVDRVYELSDESPELGIFTLGPIIHNERVVEDLNQRGVKVADDVTDVPDGSLVVIRSHGVPKSVVDQLEKRGGSYENATCPFVKKIHEIVRDRSEDGEEIVIVGSAEHPEVKGILGWTKSGGTVIETHEQAESFAPSDPRSKVCVVSQTTFNSKKFKEFVEILEKKEYNLNVVNTICRATKERQEEAAALAAECDAMIVIGGADSSNSRKLYEICKQQCENTFFIQTADSIDEISFDGFAALGITAGASTPNTLIQEVLEACQRK